MALVTIKNICLIPLLLAVLIACSQKPDLQQPEISRDTEELSKLINSSSLAIKEASWYIGYFSEYDKNDWYLLSHIKLNAPLETQNLEKSTAVAAIPEHLMAHALGNNFYNDNPNSSIFSTIDAFSRSPLLHGWVAVNVEQDALLLYLHTM